MNDCVLRLKWLYFATVFLDARKYSGDLSIKFQFILGEKQKSRKKKTVFRALFASWRHDTLSVNEESKRATLEVGNKYSNSSPKCLYFDSNVRYAVAMATWCRLQPSPQLLGGFVCVCVCVFVQAKRAHWSPALVLCSPFSRQNRVSTNPWKLWCSEPPAKPFPTELRAGGLHWALHLIGLRRGKTPLPAGCGPVPSLCCSGLG